MSLGLSSLTVNLIAYTWPRVRRYRTKEGLLSVGKTWLERLYMQLEDEFSEREGERRRRNGRREPLPSPPLLPHPLPLPPPSSLLSSGQGQRAGSEGPEKIFFGLSITLAQLVIARHWREKLLSAGPWFDSGRKPRTHIHMELR